MSVMPNLFPVDRLHQHRIEMAYDRGADTGHWVCLIESGGMQRYDTMLYRGHFGGKVRLLYTRGNSVYPTLKYYCSALSNLEGDDVTSS